jgi:hypothetical protein
MTVLLSSLNLIEDFELISGIILEDLSYKIKLCEIGMNDSL